MGEVHIIGQICGAYDFLETNLFCKWSIETGSGWKLLSGPIQGQTSVSRSNYGKVSYWGYPIDVHFVSKTIKGWPKLNLHIHHFDSYGRIQSFGYGQLHLPTSPGHHELICYIWRPVGTIFQRVIQFFIGGSPQLSDPNSIGSPTDRYQLNTESMGTVKLELYVIFRNYQEFGVEYK